MVVVKKAFFNWSNNFHKYLNEESNNEAWLCPNCHNYNPFYRTTCFFCGYEDDMGEQE